MCVVNASRTSDKRRRPIARAKRDICLIWCSSFFETATPQLLKVRSIRFHYYQCRLLLSIRKFYYTFFVTFQVTFFLIDFAFFVKLTLLLNSNIRIKRKTHCRKMFYHNLLMCVCVCVCCRFYFSHFFPQHF